MNNFCRITKIQHAGLRILFIVFTKVYNVLCCTTILDYKIMIVCGVCMCMCTEIYISSVEDAPVGRSTSSNVTRKNIVVVQEKCYSFRRFYNKHILWVYLLCLLRITAHTCYLNWFEIQHKLIMFMHWLIIRLLIHSFQLLTLPCSGIILIWYTCTFYKIQTLSFWLTHV